MNSPRFHDPASSHPVTGSDQSQANRFFTTPDGGLFRPAVASAPLGSSSGRSPGTSEASPTSETSYRIVLPSIGIHGEL